MMPQLDPLALLQALAYLYLWCLVGFAACCAAAVVIVSLWRDSLGPAGDPPPR